MLLKLHGAVKFLVSNHALSDRRDNLSFIKTGYRQNHSPRAAARHERFQAPLSAAKPFANNSEAANLAANIAL